MIDRRTFLARALAAGAAVYGGRLRGSRQAEEAPALYGESFVAGDALVASGGLCAPVTPFYALTMIPVGDHPVRDALPRIRAAA